MWYKSKEDDKKYYETIGKPEVFQWNFYWDTFCEQFPEAALYEKIHEALLGPKVFPDLGIVGYENIEDFSFIRLSLKLTNEEFEIIHKWFFKKIRIVFNDEYVYTITSFNLHQPDVFEIYFTKI